MAIILVIVISIYLIKDIVRFIRFMSITTIVSGYIIIIFNYFMRKIINSKISYINVSKITMIVYEKARDRGLLLIFIGSLELIIYMFIILYKKYYGKRIMTYQYKKENY